jgi:hypothetical protein
MKALSAYASLIQGMANPKNVPAIKAVTGEVENFDRILRSANVGRSDRRHLFNASFSRPSIRFADSNGEYMDWLPRVLPDRKALEDFPLRFVIGVANNQCLFFSDTPRSARSSG